MNTIHVAGGVGVADTAMASYDAALADANLHNYNLVAVSSVVPRGGDGRGSRSGAGSRSRRQPTHGRRRAERSAPTTRSTSGGGRPRGAEDAESKRAPRRRPDVAAGLGWATGPGPGLFYEVTGEDPDDDASGSRRDSTREATSATGSCRIVRSTSRRRPRPRPVHDGSRHRRVRRVRADPVGETPIDPSRIAPADAF